MTPRNRPHHLVVTVLVGLLGLATASCGGDAGSNTTATQPATSTTPATTELQPTVPPATVAPTLATTSPPTTGTATTSPATTSPATAAPAVDQVTAAAIEDLLAASIADGDWSCCGADGPPTGAAVAIRRGGRTDSFVATGTNVDGTPRDPAAPFLATSLTVSLVQSVAYRLIDEGVLDPMATIDAWTPSMPRAADVTVQMLIDGTSGFGDIGPAVEPNVLADLARVWTLAEVVDVASTIPPTAEPGTASPTGDTNSTVLSFVLEQVTGQTIESLVDQYVAGPLGLSGTTLSIDAPKQPGYVHGVFVLGGEALDTASVPTDAYSSFLAGEGSATSTLPDLLDLLDAWVTGDLLGADLAATPDRFLPANVSPNAPSTITGAGIPVNGYCDPRTGSELEYQCTADGSGLDVMAIGRLPNGVGSTLTIWYFPDTGISIAMHHNSQEWATRDALNVIAIEIHDLAAQATNA